MKVAFITGINGQDGSYLAEFLLSKKYKVYGIIRRASLFNTKRIDAIRDKLDLRYGDLTDSTSLSNFLHEIVSNHQQDLERLEIYNLGAMSHVKISFEIPEYVAQTDGLGTLRLLEIIRSFPKNIQEKTRFYQASTSELYGKVKQIPQSENTPFNPVSPYACAKLFAHYITNVYREGYNLYAVCGILFNHESPRRGENFVTMKIIEGVKNIVDGKTDCLILGNLNSQRDWGYAGDFVEGMWLMLQQEKPRDYVLATGKTVSVREFVEKAFKYKNINITWKGEGLDEIGVDQNGKICVKVSEDYFRPCEVDLLIGDCSDAEKILGWKPKVQNVDDLISIMFENY